jgi:CheY-like chemotaxis protein
MSRSTQSTGSNSQIQIHSNRESKNLPAFCRHITFTGDDCSFQHQAANDFVLGNERHSQEGHNSPLAQAFTQRSQVTGLWGPNVVDNQWCLATEKIFDRKINPVALAVRGQETILLVEDEPVILDMGKRMLESSGMLRALFISGYTANVIAYHGVEG